MSYHLISIYQLLDHYCNFQVLHYYAQTFTFFQMDYHQHPSFEIMYVSKGSCEVSYQIQDIDYTQSLKKGDWIFVDINIPHMLKVYPHTPCKVLNIEVALIANEDISSSTSQLLLKSDVFKNFLETKKPIIFFNLNKENNQIYSLIQNIHSYLSHNSYLQNSILVELELLKLLILIAQNYLSLTQDIVYLHYISQAKDFIYEHFDQNICIQDIAQHVGISNAYLQRIFSKQMGISIIDYITKKRIDKSIILLKNTNASILDIAIDVGFNSRQHFTYTFKKIMGISPHQFRSLKNSYEIPFSSTYS